MSMEKALALAALAKAGQGGGGEDVSFATDAEVKAGTASDKALAPSNESAASFYGLAKAAGDTTQSASSNPVGTYTAEAQAAIKSMLGVSSGGGGETWELINDAAVTEDIHSFKFTKDSQNNNFSLKKVMLFIYMPPYGGDGTLSYNYINVNDKNSLSFSDIYAPSKTNYLKNTFFSTVANNGFPYHEKVFFAQNATAKPSIANQITGASKEYINLDQEKWTDESITSIAVYAGASDTTVALYDGCILKLYGVRA